MILVIDNYDSFTYNIVQYIAEMGAEVIVIRNDQLSVDELGAKALSGIVISPGPGRPEDAGISLDVIREFGGRTPLLGVCLGHQCMGQIAGGKVISAKTLMHGKVSKIQHDGKGLFEGLPNPLTATRYHSLAVDPSGWSDKATVSARTDDGEVMGLRIDPTFYYRGRAPIEGVQFHPESILTECGKHLIGNFVKMTGGDR